MLDLFHVGALVDLVGTVDDSSTGAIVVTVGESGRFTGPSFDDDGVTLLGQSGNGERVQSDPMFVTVDFAWDSDEHGGLPGVERPELRR